MIFYSVLIALLALAAGYAVGHLLSRSQLARLKAQLDFTETRNNELTRADADGKAQLAELQTANATLTTQNSVLHTQTDNLSQQLDSVKADTARQLAEAQQRYDRQLADLKAEHQKQLEQLKEQQQEQLQQQAQLLKEQISSMSEQILKKRSDELSATNREQMSVLLTPLQEKLHQMREAVEKNDRDQADRLVKLDATIKENLRQAQQVGERADKLAQALTSENKTQGNFGELRLRTLLENMGLEEGVQFEEQTTLRDDNGNALHDDESGQRMIPDVILHFPDKRDVVIDSKMSLKAFIDYNNATTQQERDDALQRHVLSMRNHVKELAQKKYYKYVGPGNQLDFVIMYVYSEAALQLALTADTSLWSDAYRQGVIISGGQNMYMLLRVLEITWRQVKQAQNQKEMMKAADELVNRVQMFYERFQTASDFLDRTRNAFDDVQKTTAPTGKSIATAARKLIKCGAQENTRRKARIPLAPDDEAETSDESLQDASKQVPDKTTATQSGDEK